MEIVSPKFQMELIQTVEKVIWKKYSTKERVQYYIQKWKDIVKSTPLDFVIDGGFWGSSIELFPTLGNMKFDLLVKIALELEINVPSYIPSIPTFIKIVKEEYTSAYDAFHRALKLVDENPDLAIGIANSTLESIIKEITKDERIKVKYSKGKTLYELTHNILKEFKIFPEKELPEEIQKIGSSLLQISQHIEKIRSDKTIFHGKTSEDYVVTDSLYAFFVINAVTTVGLFIHSFYKAYILKNG